MGCGRQDHIGMEREHDLQGRTGSHVGAADFGVLEGAVQKRITLAYLPVESFSYGAFYLKQHEPSGAKLLGSPEWTLFFLSREGVERSLFEAHQNGLLEYHAAGSVSRLTFPAKNLEEYANVLAQR